LTGLPVIILKVKGAKSGLERRTPLVGVFEGDKIILIASYFGNRRHPAWYHNIKTNPKVQVEYKGVEKTFKAYEVEGDERKKYWELAEDFFLGYRNYKKWAGDRQIPVIVLEPNNYFKS
jgi:deazaflavin-dependent oxidoreductase (nitroreductase family)